MPGLPTLPWVKIGAAALTALLLFLLIQDRNHWKSKAMSYNGEVVRAYEATKIAADNPKLERANLPAQIQAMGLALVEVTGALNKQNAALRRAKIEGERVAGEAEKALQARREAILDAKSARERLEASARDPARQAKPCDLSDTLKEQWQ